MVHIPLGSCWVVGGNRCSGLCAVLLARAGKARTSTAWTGKGRQGKASTGRARHRQGKDTQGKTRRMAGLGLLSAARPRRGPLGFPAKAGRSSPAARAWLLLAWQPGGRAKRRECRQVPACMGAANALPSAMGGIEK